MKLYLILVFCVAFGAARKGFGEGEQEWGFSEVREGAFMFWWLYYTTAPVDPTTRPILIWLQGGPGGSSTGYGNFEELGPIDSNLKPRNSTWVKDANVLFINNPVGTGFSYVTSNDLLTTTNKQIARDLVEMMRDFYNKYPKLRACPLYITGESYGGKMIAEFALELHEEIKSGKIEEIPFEGVALGDSWISPLDSLLSWAPYLLNLGFIDDRGYQRIMEVAKDTEAAVLSGRWANATNLWSDTQNMVSLVAYEVDFYNVLLPITYFDDEDRKHRIPALPGPPRRNTRNLEDIMNLQVKEALDLPKHLYWSDSNKNVFNTLNEDFMKPVVHIVESLLNNTDIKVAVFNGQLDLIVNTPGVMQWIENMQWQGKDSWLKASRDPLLSNDIWIEGFVKKSGNFAMYWVNRAGHMVPADNPAGMDLILRQLTNDYQGNNRVIKN